MEGSVLFRELRKLSEPSFMPVCVRTQNRSLKLRNTKQMCSAFERNLSHLK
jgi:hypothetical protein